MNYAVSDAYLDNIVGPKYSPLGRQLSSVLETTWPRIGFILKFTKPHVPVYGMFPFEVSKILHDDGLWIMLILIQVYNE